MLTKFGWKTPQTIDGSHMIPIQIIRLPQVGIHKWNQYFKFCFVRNPWDRYVSSFLFLQKAHEEEGTPPYHTFEQYINSGGYEGMHQYEFLFDHINNYGMNFIGQFETFNDSVKILYDKLNLPKFNNIPHQNKHVYPNRKHYTEYYTEQWMIDAVAQREHVVIAKFNYKFGEDGNKWR